MNEKSREVFSVSIPHSLKLDIKDFEYGEVPHIGQWLRATLFSSFKIIDLAKILGIGRPALSNFLNGKADLSIDLAIKIERKFLFRADVLLHFQVDYKLNERGYRLL